MRRVVVTGMGAVSPIGNDVKSMWEAAKAGTCGIAEITHFDTSNHEVKIAGEVKDFDPSDVLSKSEMRKTAPFTMFALAAAKEAFADSGIDLEKEDRDRIGIIFSSGIGGLGIIEREEQRGLEKTFDRVSPHFVPMAITNVAAGQIAIKYGITGMCTCVVTACASANNSIGDAFRQIKDGYHDVMVAGGAESSITELGIGGFTSMHALCKSNDPMRASIPFDAERSGFVMGEGAGVLILEDYERAKKRGANIYCEIVGYGSTCDAHHVTAPREDGSMAAKAMTNAMSEAGISPSDIDYINAHGTSTPLNDKGETFAVKKAFGDSASKVMMSSTKSMTGHLLGASGAIEGVLSVLCVQNDVVLPTIGYKEFDEDCDLDIVPNEMRETKVNYAMSNSFGFGGHNASVIFKKCID